MKVSARTFLQLLASQYVCVSPAARLWALADTVHDSTAQQSSSLAIATIPLSSHPSPTFVGDSPARNLSVNAKSNVSSTLLPSTCVLTSSYCSLAPNPQGTGARLDINGLDDECLLWDDSCSGNRSFAISKFFGGAIGDLTDNVCFEDVEYYNCSSHNPSTRLHRFEEIKSWMRSPECFPAHDEYQAAYNAAHPRPPGAPDGQTGKRKRSLDDVLLQNSTARKYGTCCGICNLGADNVDVYYWPDPAADESCLGIIGDSVLPPEHGATTETERRQTYWGCTISATGTGLFVDSILTTARLMITGSLSWKAYEFNPWSPLPTPCLSDTKTLKPLLSSSNVTSHNRRSLYARGHSLVASTDQNGDPISTVVSGDFTFTSPSVYANFHNLNAGDSCGSTVFPSTLLSFPPGGLSTVVGPRYFGHIASETRPFNFADVPCPPRSVAEENYYSPAPGEPYRPLIAVPSQVTEMVPWFRYCQDYFFTGYDPPRPLVALASMAPASWPSSAPQSRPTPAVEAAFDQNLPPAAPGPTHTTPGPQPTNDPGSESVFSYSGLPFTESASGSNIENIAAVGPVSRTSPTIPPDQATAADLSTSTAKAADQADIDEQSEEISSVTVWTTMVAGHNIMKGPSNIIVDGIRISSDDDPITLSNAKAIRHEDKFILAQNIIQLSAPSPTIAISTQTIDGHIIEIAPKGVRVDGKPIQPGSAGKTENGISISLDASEWLMLGTKSYHLLPPPSPTSSVAYTTILPDGAKALVLAQGGVSVAGTTIMPGAAEASVSGTRISLDASYNLVFNGRVVTLPTDRKVSSRPGNGDVPADQSSTPTTVTDSPSGSALDPGNTFMALDRETTEAGDTYTPVGSSYGKDPTPPGTTTSSKAPRRVPNSILPLFLWLLYLLLYPPILLLS